MADATGHTWNSVLTTWEASSSIDKLCLIITDDWSIEYSKNKHKSPFLIQSRKPCEINLELASFVLKNFRDPTEIFKEGIRVGREKYFALHCNPRTIHCKYESLSFVSSYNSSRKGASGIIFVRCRGACIVVQYSAPITASQCLCYVESLADIANEGIAGVHTGVAVTGEGDNS
ncbi:hypothetical protein GUITHDRAFT_135993 [Guillardia theta CCMP2712]|uniref:Profilin n=1 Tax=Guillardia theta (strain CCMP2712) TaxID=905079 RepID=L1JLS5_GUITC|nr:hypothetical protein GUITHDRAFT_135993 [Guillardia theta CCMP2712]EKX49302.1 hypothetical protein GUITHDRAFT_135993 [Guillardia theta CCMP2712]|eukprot:XP_005836282.1 hypothetical protein GUITHDRAFT_135993 [Guillardia theta CCMP2712]